MPSSFIKKAKNIRGPIAKKKCITYERDIILLLKYYQGDDGNIRIPRGAAHEELASNGLIGKIVLNSSMIQSEIFDEIRTVFRHQMRNNNSFRFTILQHTGGGSKMLTLPSLSDKYEWTASAVAGRIARSPVYILAMEELEVMF